MHYLTKITRGAAGVFLKTNARQDPLTTTPFLTVSPDHGEQVSVGLERALEYIRDGLNGEDDVLAAGLEELCRQCQSNNEKYREAHQAIAGASKILRGVE